MKGSLANAIVKGKRLKTSLATRKHVWKWSQQAKCSFHFFFFAFFSFSHYYFSVSLSLTALHRQNSFSRECDAFVMVKKELYCLEWLPPPTISFRAQEMTYLILIPFQVAFSFDGMGLWLDMVFRCCSQGNGSLEREGKK